MSQVVPTLEPARTVARRGQLIKARPVYPKALTPAQRDALADELYAVQKQIFGGVSRTGFRKYVIDSPAERTRIQVFRDGDTGAAVGFAAVHVFELHLDDGPLSLMRAEVGLAPGWRGRSAAAGLLLSEGLRLALRSPLRRACFLACPVHPASYLALSRSCSQVWPRPDTPTPAGIQHIMDRLDDQLGMERPDGAGDGVRKVGWVTRQGPPEARFWADHTDPRVRFYIDQNPGYTRGDGLLIVAPVDWTSVVEGAWSTVERMVQRSTRSLRNALRPVHNLIMG